MAEPGPKLNPQHLREKTERKRRREGRMGVKPTIWGKAQKQQMANLLS